MIGLRKQSNKTHVLCKSHAYSHFGPNQKEGM